MKYCCPATQASPFVAFTVCSRNFLAQAQVLHDGLKRNYRALAFYVALCDDLAGLDEAAFPFEILPIRELGIPSLEEMSHRYNITELNTAIKPFVFLELFDRHPGAVVAYFDPDIYVTSRLEELEEALGLGADCVLTRIFANRPSSPRWMTPRCSSMACTISDFAPCATCRRCGA